MATLMPVQKQTVRANGADLYCEMRGSGPAILFIAGALGDAGFYEPIGEELGEAFTCITYDRRGNSRSPRPSGWTSTSIEEQAEDAAALINALGMTPLGVFGSSGGGTIALDLVVRHPELVRGAVLHEPYVTTALGEQAAAIDAKWQSVLTPIYFAKGPRGAVEAFVRMVGGDTTYEALDPGLRERILDNGDVAFLVESPAYQAYRPTAATLAGIQRPVRVLASEDTALPYLKTVCDWLAGQLHTSVGHLSGGHGAYLARPSETASILRPYLAEITSNAVVEGRPRST
jgi:pimeloyl-ACP methyl ester carboxylesterase